MYEYLKNKPYKISILWSLLCNFTIFDQQFKNMHKIYRL